MSNLIGKPQFNKRGLVFRVGVNDYPFSTKVNGIEIKPYRVWKDMLKRCYSNSYKMKYKTYENVKCCSEWLVFSNFLKDTELMENAFEEGFDMDKDVLGDGKFYSRETVCFIPSELNSKFGAHKGVSSAYGSGIRFENNKYCVRGFSNGKEKSLGRFEDLSKAQECSVNYRKSKMIECVNKYDSIISLEMKLILIDYVNNKLFN